MTMRRMVIRQSRTVAKVPICCMPDPSAHARATRVVVVDIDVAVGAMSRRIMFERGRHRASADTLPQVRAGRPRICAHRSSDQADVRLEDHGATLDDH